MINENVKFKKTKIILSGGGTGGSVTPLLQIHKDLKNEFDFLFVGTYKGIEREIIKKEDIPYRPILSGKWRRYFSLFNFLDIFKIFFAFWQSLFLLKKEKPGLVISAGGFVAVPLSLASWFLKIPIIVHQQDVAPGLANKIMSKVAKVTTLTFSKSLDNYSSKAKLIGNLGPNLEDFSFDKQAILRKYKIEESNFPLVLVLGGGTGSVFLNRLISDSMEDLVVFSTVFHVSGKKERDVQKHFVHKNYKKIDFIPHQDILALLFVADLVVSRCGLGTLTELSFFKKPAILIPMPNSHQEFNAKEFAQAGAAKVLAEDNLRPDIFINEVRNILNNSELKNRLSEKISSVIRNGNNDMVKIIKQILN
ncbi:MAG: UDP-N-acetylglucosamine--N-acetylmuramyl-(pentapeptide) pyrophosphoryl-undecaprenol N-acetylglucosamine transferase [Patescibacteria group bacterium]|jgi:UDP-N-acetylglucosamine--N-acetylmuramyl-(pentapeptide) pyrophosphoryl-undecaprenol N-acetylglucosamine transferase